ncbi:MAG: HipA domain-containing protein [Ignavibacteriae bacterium]|nr:HipA domain-containing protein [Ignavibacteriota bacterium]
MTQPQRCLFCYRALDDGSRDFHAACSRKMFGTPQPPELPYSEADMFDLAVQVVRSQIAVPGVQEKLSLELEKPVKSAGVRRFTIVGMWGRYILKPPSQHYPHLPEVEDCTMHLAELAGIRTVPHSLIRLHTGQCAYITRRIDRMGKDMLHMEDMCQLTGRLTEHKYHGSHEQIATAILQFSAHPLLDVGLFYEQVVFSFLTGNADMHLKNFSLINRPSIGWTLAPAYDMVATKLVIPEDREELALTLDGRKKNLTKKNFTNAFDRAGMDEKVVAAMLRRFEKALPKWVDRIRASFLPDRVSEQYTGLIVQRAERLGITVP